MSTTQKPLHVLIVGAGLAGLTLAQALRKQGISYEVFERDTGIHSRFQGWAIALHRILPDFRASLPEDLGPVETTNHLLPLDKPAQFSYYFDNKLVSRVTSDEEFQLVRANRNRLRDYLVQNINVKWGKNWTSIEEGPGSVTLHFDDGSSATGDLLVGADGVHSKVRSHKLSGKDPLYTIPVSIIVGETSLPKEDYERIMDLGHSAYAASTSTNPGIFAGVNSIAPDSSYANYYWMAMRPEPTLVNNELPWTHHATQSEQYAEALQRIRDFDPRYTELIKLTGEKGISTSPIVLRDVVLDKLPLSRVTLIGDAAHAMAPNRGEGGNTALQDSLDLARTIKQISLLSVDDEKAMLNLLNTYQEAMLARARPIVLASRAAAMSAPEHDPNGHFESWQKSLSGSIKAY